LFKGHQETLWSSDKFNFSADSALKHKHASISNSLNLPSRAEHLVEVFSLAEAQQTMIWAKSEGRVLRCLGEGSNVVLMENLQGTICKIKYADIKVIDRNDEHIWVDVGAGKNWHEFVQETLEQGWFGLENLSLIPGAVGAAPVQNIGAYGVEVADFIDSVQVLQPDGSLQTLSREACGFGYRDSYFKRAENLISGLGRQIIVSVRLRLLCRPHVNVYYDELAQTLDVSGTDAPSRHLPSPKQVSEAVIEIRQRKLPDPAHYPNAGSFFKNPIVNQGDARRLGNLGLRPYAFENSFKVSAAQMIDLAGWKGIRQGDVGCWPEQPLVFVNYGNATAPEVLDFASTVQRSVQADFQVELELEPSVVS